MLLLYARANRCENTNEASWLLCGPLCPIETSRLTMLARACRVGKLGPVLSICTKIAIRSSGDSSGSAKIEMRHG